MKIRGSKLAAIRERQLVTRAELAQAADLTHARIWQIDTNDVSNLNLNIVKAIAKRLKVSVEELQ